MVTKLNTYRIWHFTGKPFPNQSATDTREQQGTSALDALQRFAADRGLDGYRTQGRKQIWKLGAHSFYADKVA